MEAVNIYTYSRIQEDMATEFENILSQRSKKLAVKVQEFAAIKTLVDLLLDITTLIISKKPGNTGISRDIRTEFTTDLLLSD